MSRPRSPALLAALAMVADGCVPYQAAKACGVLQSTLSRAIKADLSPHVPDLCPTCGKARRAAK